MKMKNFEAQAALVWAAPTLEEKKDILLEMVGQFHSKGQFNVNVGRWTRSVEWCKSKREADRMASSLALGEGLKVLG